MSVIPKGSYIVLFAERINLYSLTKKGKSLLKIYNGTIIAIVKICLIKKLMIMKTLALLCDSKKEYDRISFLISKTDSVTAYTIIVSEVKRSNEVSFFDYMTKGDGKLDYMPYVLSDEEDFCDFEKDLKQKIRKGEGVYLHCITISDEDYNFIDCVFN